MKANISQLDRGDSSLLNVFRMFRPLLEQKELIGKKIKMTEFVQIWRNHQARLPMRIRRAIDLAHEFLFMAKCSSMQFDDLIISVYIEFDPETRRHTPEIEFQLAVSLEQQCLNEMQMKGLPI